MTGCVIFDVAADGGTCLRVLLDELVVFEAWGSHTETIESAGLWLDSNPEAAAFFQHVAANDASHSDECACFACSREPA